jgi:Protein of unknown function (DUF1554)
MAPRTRYAWSVRAWFVVGALAVAGGLVGACSKTYGSQPAYEPDAATAGADAAVADAEASAEADADADASLPPLLVFATSAEFNGGFGGLASADSLCTTAAANAGRSGRFVAFLAIAAGISPSITTLPRGRDWVLPTGTVAFHDRPDVLGAHVAGVALDESESGETFSSAVSVWTGLDNQATTYTCVDWTTSTGVGTGSAGSVGCSTCTDDTWKDQGTTPLGCMSTASLFCFETP